MKKSELKQIIREEISKLFEQEVSQEVKDEVIALLKSFNGKKVPDEEIHAIAEKHKINPHDLEDWIYSLASQHVSECLNAKFNESVKLNESKYYLWVSSGKQRGSTASGYDVDSIADAFEFAKHFKENQTMYITDKNNKIVVPKEKFKKLALDYERKKHENIKEMEGDAIPGGKGDKTNPEDVDKDELAVGIEVELEHTKDRKKAEEIALDHLAENPKYYSELVGSGIVDEKPALDLAKKLGVSEATLREDKFSHMFKQHKSKTGETAFDRFVKIAKSHKIHSDKFDQEIGEIWKKMYPGTKSLSFLNTVKQYGISKSNDVKQISKDFWEYLRGK